MDEMEWPDRKDRPGLRASMDETARRERLEHQARAVVPDWPGPVDPMEWTDERVALDRAERRARLGIPDPAGPLVRRVRSARRGTRALREILARLVRRANL